MGSGMAFLGGFVLGGVTSFIVLAVPMRRRYWELTVRWQRERARRIEAEDNGRHTNDALRAVSSHEWGGPLTDLGIPGNEANRPQSVDETPAPTVFIDNLDDFWGADDG
jgi:hypothetical protein